MKKIQFETTFIYQNTQAIGIKVSVLKFDESTWHDNDSVIHKPGWHAQKKGKCLIHPQRNKPGEGNVSFHFCPLKGGVPFWLNNQTISHQVPFMLLFGPPGIFPSGRISNINATCQSYFLTTPVICRVNFRKYLLSTLPSKKLSTGLLDESLAVSPQGLRRLVPQLLPICPL